MDPTTNSSSIYADEVFVWSDGEYVKLEPGGGGGDAITQEELNAALLTKANANNAAFSGTTTGITAAMVGLGSVNNTADTAKPVSTATQTALNLKANVNNAAFTGTTTGITAAMVGLGSVNNTADSAKPVSSATQSALNAKVNVQAGNLNVPTVILSLRIWDDNANEVHTFNTLSASTMRTNVTFTENITVNKAFTVNGAATFNGNVLGINKTHVGLSNVSNLAPADLPLSTATTTALSTKQNALFPVAAPGSVSPLNGVLVRAFEGSPDVIVTVSDDVIRTALNPGRGLSTVASTLFNALSTALDSKANIADPLFTGTAAFASLTASTNVNFTGASVLGLTKAAVGLSNVENLSPASMPISLATQQSLDDKADLSQLSGKQNSLLFTIPPAPGLSILSSGTRIRAFTPQPNVTTLSVDADHIITIGLDANRAVSSATQTALNLKANLAGPTTFTGTVTFSGGTSGLTRSSVGLGSVDNTSDLAKPISTAVQNQLNTRPPFELGAGLDWSSILGPIGIIDIRPFVSVLVASNGTVTSSMGLVTISNANITRIGNFSKAYQITFAGQNHPKGTDYVPMAMIRTSASSSWATTAAHGIPTTKVETAGSASIWFRHPNIAFDQVGGLVDQNYHFFTIP